jgi:hypothetical protein
MPEFALVWLPVEVVGACVKIVPPQCAVGIKAVYYTTTMFKG